MMEDVGSVAGTKVGEGKETRTFLKDFQGTWAGPGGSTKRVGRNCVSSLWDESVKAKIESSGGDGRGRVTVGVRCWKSKRPLVTTGVDTGSDPTLEESRPWDMWTTGSWIESRSTPLLKLKPGVYSGSRGSR